MLSKISQPLIVLGLVVTSMNLVSCKGDDADKVAQAQKCMDQLSDADYRDAKSACLGYIEGINTVQANILKCSIVLTYGGLTTTRILNSFTNLNDGDSKESAFMGLLTMEGVPSGSDTNGSQDALNTAKEAAGYCNATGDAGLIFIGNMAVAGTTLSSVIPGIDFSNLNESTLTNSSTLNSAIDTCVAGSSTCDKDALGGSVVAISNSYCTGSNADQNICGEVNSAIASGGSNSDIAETFLNLLK